MMEMEKLVERLKAAGTAHAKLFVSENIYISGKPRDIQIAANCFAVVAALSARAQTQDDE